MSRSYKSSLVSQKHLNALKRAIEEAASWRGSIIGRTDVEEFDEFIDTAKAALKSVRKLNREVRLERRRPTPCGLTPK